jgi:hypothetical protein
MTEQLRIIDRALWVDHGDGNLDALTRELPVWADEWAERIVAAVNARRVIETDEELDDLPDGTVILDANEEFHRLNPYGMSEPRTWFPAWLTGNAYATDFGQDPELPATVLWTPENGDTE